MVRVSVLVSIVNVLDDESLTFRPERLPCESARKRAHSLDHKRVAEQHRQRRAAWKTASAHPTLVKSSREILERDATPW